MPNLGWAFMLDGAEADSECAGGCPISTPSQTIAENYQALLVGPIKIENGVEFTIEPGGKVKIIDF